MKTIWIFLLFSLTANAGVRDVGNGGELIVCHGSSGNQTYEVFDHFEARVLRQLPIDLGPASATFQEKIQFVLNRLSKREPGRAALYSGWASDLLAHAQWTKQTLDATSDVDPNILPNGCELAQIAIQDSETYSNVGPRVTLNKTLWNHLDSDNQATLILHEVIFHDVQSRTEFQVQSAAPVRLFNEYLISPKILTLSCGDYYDLANETIGYIEDQGLNLRIGKGADFCEKGGEVELAGEQTYLLNGSPVSLHRHSLVVFYPSGKVEAFQKVTGAAVRIGSATYNVDGELGLDRNSNITWLQLGATQDGCSDGYYVELDPSGKILSCAEDVDSEHFVDF